jgi:hypothetical protein
MLLHDEVMLAVWALAFGRDQLPEALSKKWALLAGATEDERRLVQLAGARPVVAVTTGLAAAVLAMPYVDDERAWPPAPASDPEAAMRKRATMWLAFGEAPVIVVASDVLAPAASPLPPSARSAPVSLRP